MTLRHSKRPPHKHADQFTIWDECSIKMENSSHGTMTFEEWCEAEVVRMGTHGDVCHVRRRNDNKNQCEVCAVFFGEAQDV